MVMSLLDKNCKEVQFTSQKSLIIRTLDKQYGLEFVDDNFYKNTTFFKKYIKHLRREKNSFIPSILGIFKIKINNFKEINFIIVKNNFVEEFPKDLFNYWQILRISNNKKIDLLSTSKERQSLIITEEPILSYGKKLALIEYNTYKDILGKDLEFLRSMKVIDFSLIFLYYEIGANSSNFSMEDDKTPIDFANSNLGIKEQKEEREKKYSNAGQGLGENNKSNFNTNDKSNVKNIRDISLLNRISNVQFRTSNQVGGNDFSYENSIKLDLSNLQDGKGFEAINNNLKSIIFFNFENVFQSFSYFEKISIYDEFKRYLISFFDESYT